MIKEKKKEKQSMIQNIPKCSQITKKGVQCSFKAIINGFCKKHGSK